MFNQHTIPNNHIFLIGYMGSGKTTIGKILSKKKNLPLIDLDEQIAQSAGKSISEIFETDGESTFRLIEHSVLGDVIRTKDVSVIACGGGTPCFFNNMEEMLKVGFVVYLRNSAQQLISGIESSGVKRPKLEGLSPELMETYITQEVFSREPWYLKAHFIINSHDTEIVQCISQIENAYEIFIRRQEP